MALPEVVTPEQWLEARKQLLVAEKEETRRRDALNTGRRRLPMVRIEKQYLQGWTIPWCSSRGSDFNYDFRATVDNSVPQPRGQAPRLHCPDPTFSD
jgi:predicted dithiol-disulfide oxidoreductase (DUF899 family)